MSGGVLWRVRYRDGAVQEGALPEFGSVIDRRGDVAEFHVGNVVVRLSVGQRLIARKRVSASPAGVADVQFVVGWYDQRTERPVLLLLDRAGRAVLHSDVSDLGADGLHAVERGD